MTQKDDAARDEAKARLLEAEREYQRARTDDYLTRLVRDSAMVESHRAGLSSREISELLGGIGQPNDVRARRRAEAQRKTFPQGLFSPTEALRESGLGVKEFVTAVREGRTRPIEPAPGVRAFRPEDLRGLARASSER